MKDALAPVVSTNLDLHFGRLAGLSPDAEAYPELIRAASQLARDIAAHLLGKSDDGPVDASVQQHIFERNAGLPPWLVNKALVICQNDRAKIEPAVRQVLRHDFYRRRFFDYVSNELLYYSWFWTREDARRSWLVHHLGGIRKNRYCLDLNSHDYVLKFENNSIEKLNADPAVCDWYFRSLGTATLLELATKPIFEYTARLVEAKYKTPFLLTLFRNLFTQAYQGPSLGRFGVFVLGDIPKVFGLEAFLNVALAAGRESFSRDIGALELFRRILGRFDRCCRTPESRFRIGGEPPQMLVNRIGAMYWLRKTLDAAKTMQRNKALPPRGLKVEELTVLESALKQKSILYFRLFDDPNDTAINPCSIKTITEDSMILQSPRGNRLNEAANGDEVHGYFSIGDRGQKSTYCDFRANVLDIQDGDGNGNSCLVQLSLPAVFELTRRTHKRLPLDPRQLGLFEMSSPTLGADWNAFTSMENWPSPFCIIPDGASHCNIRDLSASGMMLEIHEDAPAYGYFIEGNKEYPLLAFLHLVGQACLPDLKIGLRLEMKNIRDIPQLHKKYVGFQFVESGEVRQDRLVRFAAVGSEGIFLVNDWLFRNSIVR